MRLEDYIQDIPDFPKPGIVFKDITPLFLDAKALRHTVDELAAMAREWEVDVRGLGGGARLRARRGGGGGGRGRLHPRSQAGQAPARGRLPSSTQLEYGSDALEVHSDAIRDGARVLVHDDLLATGGTAGALCKLVEQAGGVVAGCAFVIELAFLGGRERLAGYDVRSLVVVEAE